MRAMFLTLATALLFFGTVYLIFYWSKRGHTFHYDPGGRKGEFEKHADRYQSLARLLLTLASASVAFVVNFLVTLDSGKIRSKYSFKLEAAAPVTVTLLCLTAASCIGFLLFQNLFYEDYVHSKYPADGSAPRETYTGARYALILAFAGAGFVFFLAAYGILAVWMFV